MATEFDPPERFIAATVGPPGERVFFLQARRAGRVMTVSLEKEQVKLLGERLGSLLDQVAGTDATPAAAAGVMDNAPMDTPIEDEFRVQTLSMVWDQSRRVVVIEAREIDLDADEQAALEEFGDATLTGDQSVGGVMRVVLPPAQARAFVQRCESAIEGGRPPCPFCGQPLDPTGHICPRANGYRR